MKKMIFVLGCLLIVGCQRCPERGSCSEPETPTTENTEARYAPEGTELIKDYGGTWTKWKLDDECFLSYNLRAGNGLLTKVSCDLEEGEGE
jgi:hypothetical protein